MIKTPLAVVRVAVFCLPLALVASCGSGTEAVQGTTMNIDPPALGQTTELGTPGTATQYYRVEAMSPTGYPQIGVKIIIDSRYIVFSGTPVITCTVVLGVTTCTASAPPLFLPYEATTDSNGTYGVTVLYDWPDAISGAFTALQAWSGTGYGTSDITFTCTDPITTDTTECP